MFRLKAPGRRVAQALLAMGVVASTAVTGATPAAATWKATYGTYPNGVTYYVEINTSSTYVSAYAETSSNYSEATLVIIMCSGTGVCGTTMASNRNYNTWNIGTGNPASFGHTYKACLSTKFGTSSYPMYCTALAA